MDRIRRTDLQQLVALRSGPCVSLFMPMHVTDRNAQEDIVRLRKLTDEAEEQLISRGSRRLDAAKLVEPLRALPDGGVVWQHRGHAFAFFAAPGFTRMFRTGGQIEPSVHVNDRFYVLPLLPLVTEEERFFVLALSQNAFHLFEGNASELQELPLSGVPKNLAEAIDIEEPERGEQVHSSSSKWGATGKQAAVFHGQGGKPETIKDDMRQFLRRIAPSVDKRLNGEQAPLVLATVEATVPLWREVSRYKFLAGDFVAGNADHLSPAELHAKAWPIVQPALVGHRQACERRLRAAEGAKVASSLRDIVPAAIGGRISALFIDCRRSRWGRYDAANHVVVLHEQRESGDQDLVELAAVETMLHGGDVFNLRPEQGATGESAEALLRF